MKELEKRIDIIEQGHLDRLLKDYNYHQMLATLLSSINGDLRVGLKPVAERLLKKVNTILYRPAILQNTAIKVHDSSWEDKTYEEHSQNYIEFDKKEPNFYQANILGEIDEDADINHFMDKMMKFVEAPIEKKQHHESYLREELQVYRGVLQNIIGLNESLPDNDPLPFVNSVSSIEATDQNEIIEQIKAKLEPIKNNLSPEDLHILADSLQQFMDTGYFPDLKRPIQVFDCKNVRAFGWAVNRVFKYNNKKLPVELFVFASKNISIFIGEPFDLKNFRDSNIYKYFTSKAF